MKKSFTFLIISLLFFSCGKKVQDTKKLPGDKNSFDVITAIPAIGNFLKKDNLYLYKGLYDVEDPQLLRFKAEFVKSDGTLDLEAEYEPTVHYEFIVTIIPDQKKNSKLSMYAEALEEEKAAKEQPMGAGKPETDKQEKEILKPPTSPEPGLYFVEIIKPYKIKHTSVSSTGPQSGGSMWADVHGGMTRSWQVEKEETKELWNKLNENPELSKGIEALVPLSEIWKKAISAGAPDHAVAIIRFDIFDGYTFEIRDTEYKFTFDFDGSLIE